MGLFQNDEPEHSCFWCEHYGGPVADYSHAVCVRDARPLVQAVPRSGCALWVRATGIDDDARPRDPFQRTD